jgi:hypothetical protein
MSQPITRGEWLILKGLLLVIRRLASDKATNAEHNWLEEVERSIKP